jgi:hypothetical protein
MALRHAAGLFLAICSLQAPAVETAGTPAFLQEPDYFLAKDEGKWIVRKPAFRIFDATERDAWPIFESDQWARAEQLKNGLPPLRLNRALVTFNPLTRRRTPVADWSGQKDALEVEEDLRALLRRFGSPAAWELHSSVPFYMARLSGASGYTAEEPDDATRFVIYLDPFRATGRLHAASTWVHELAHVERYRSRGFHANRAAPVLSKADFILLGVSDELAGYRAEAALIESFFKSLTSEALRRSAREAMPSPRLRWPVALRTLLGLEREQAGGGRVKQARRHIVLDLERQAGRYWEMHRGDQLPPELESAIRSWHSGSPEWKDIARERSQWAAAGAGVRIE